MANFFDLFKYSKNKKRVIPLIFVLDTSGSMCGERIEYLKMAFDSLFERISDYNKNEVNNVCIKVAILKFSSGAQWMTNGLVNPTECRLPDIVADGVTNLGCALEELNNKLTHKELFAGLDIVTPSIFFVSDGGPTDNYYVALEKLMQNKDYKAANKIAIAIGDDADCGVLKEVTGSLESVVHIYSAMLIEKILVGLCTSFNIPINVTTTPQPVTPEVTFENNDFDSDEFCSSVFLIKDEQFDSDSLCTSRMVGEQADFDSDDICYTCALDENGNELGTDNNIEIHPAGDSASTSDFTHPSIQIPNGKLPGKIPGRIIQCSKCGCFVADNLGSCPYCGVQIQTVASNNVNVSQVQFSAVVPRKIIKDEYSMIDIIVYEEMYRNIVERVIDNADDEVKEVIGGSKDIIDNTLITIKLSSPDMELSDCEETQKWQGKYLTFSFPIEIPSSYAKKKILFVATVYFNDVIATKLKFIVDCTSSKEQKIMLTREDVLTAFISYASQDRSKVATIIQGMQKARPDMDIFFDVESLRSGEDWESALRREIENRDVLFLCWSNFAKNSEWVEKEWRYALINKGLDSIEPVPLVSPSECPPPEELKSKHFNDRALLYKDM